MTTKSSGFTLIELLVVVAIIGILAAVATQSYSGYVSSSKRKSAENVMQQISLGQTEFYSSNGSYYSAATGSCTATKATSNEIEAKLLGGADAISKDLGYQICIHSDSSNYMVKAKADTGNCEIKMTAHGTFTKNNC